MKAKVMKKIESIMCFSVASARRRCKSGPGELRMLP
jgi:hypothetical protein